ncbi:MAG: adenylosuccinate synthase [Dehalococcoidia bacterium]|nr:adenylosuccinate synthase [Dehalococcoidia bacterium]
MPVTVIVGVQWGDEGKGKVIDLLAEKASMVVRFSGGPNAGHTVYNPHGKFTLHLVPAGIFYPHTTCIIGNGVVISPSVLLGELDELADKGIDTSRLFISARSHLIMPYHTLLDKLEEEARGKAALGTTRSGVGPAYMDKVGRLGIRAGDLTDLDGLRQRLRFVLDQKNTVITKIYGAPPLSFDDVYDQYCSYAKRLAPMIRETEPIVAEAIERNHRVLLEGAQGSLLDVDFGTYPYVTSSSVIAAGAFSGLGLSPTKIDYVFGVVKAYTTRVGAGPMPTELHDETGEKIRQIAQEFGATTGRARRCGWFDAVAARFSTRINGFNGLVLTRLDVLDSFPSIKICIAYRLNGVVTDRFPTSIAALEKCQPVYEELPGWQCRTADMRRFSELPKQARDYIRRLEELMGCPIDIISIGPRREESITIRPIP